MQSPSERRQQEMKRMSKKDKTKQIFKMIIAVLAVGAIFALGYIIIFFVGLFFFS